MPRSLPAPPADDLYSDDFMSPMDIAVRDARRNTGRPVVRTQTEGITMLTTAAATKTSDLLADTRILTIQQPFASQIIDGSKVVENRTWATAHRGLLLIHAGCGDPKRIAAKFGMDPESVSNTDYPTGAIIGAVTLVAVHRTETDLPGGIAGYLHWELRNPIQFDNPIPVKGKLGLWKVPAEVAVEEQLAEALGVLV